MRIARVSHAVFAATLIALGIAGLVQGSFTAIWLPVPKWLPAREAFAHLCAIVALACGIGILWTRTAVIASRVLFVFLSLWLLLRVPAIVLAPASTGTWWACGKAAVMVDRTVGMVRSWLPWHLGFASFTGCAFVIAGVAVLIDVYARLAATLTTVQLALFTLLVWSPSSPQAPTPRNGRRPSRPGR